MGIRLHDIIITPGAELAFRQELAVDRLNFPSVLEYIQLPVGEGVIRNEAEAVTLYGEIRCRMRCVCDLCTAEFECDKVVPLEVPIAVNEQDEDNPEYFPLEGEVLDIDAVCGGFNLSWAWSSGRCAGTYAIKYLSEK